ncbi:MAG: toprim domain-containing protein [Candidatus Thorarchaeota archaeon]|nr:MAG: toprim domain-containing protein [Candidatus Thorarchaeota archaeon]
MTDKEPESLRRKVDIFKTRSKDLRRWGRLQEQERELVEIIQSLDSKYEGLLIVVEGKRDVIVLENLGVNAPIIKTQSGSSRIEMAEKIANEAGEKGKVLILTDYDKEGKEICRFIEKELELKGIKVLKRERRMIRKCMGPWRCIEELDSLFRRSDSPEASR